MLIFNLYYFDLFVSKSRNIALKLDKQNYLILLKKTKNIWNNYCI